MRAKQGVNMEQDDITLTQKKIMKNRFKENKKPDDYHILDRAGAGYNNLSTYWSQQTQFTSPPCTCGTEYILF